MKHATSLLLLLLLLGSAHLEAKSKKLYLCNILVDASSKISKKDFEAINEAVASFLNDMRKKYAPKKKGPKQFVSVRWFGNRGKLVGTPYIKFNSSIDIELYKTAISDRQHPKYGETAIFEALSRTYMQQARSTMALARPYKKKLVVITMSNDTDSDQDRKEHVDSLFPKRSTKLDFICIGKVDIEEFNGYGDVKKIKSPKELRKTLKSIL